MSLNPRIPLLACCLLSLALLLPGITLPFISLTANINRQAIIHEGKQLIKAQSLHPAMTAMASQFLDGLKVKGTSQLYHKTQSILGTAADLWRSGHLLVAVLILLFSVMVPAIKSLLLLGVLAIKTPQRLLRLNSALGKWSLADVFAIAIIIACLAANGGSPSQQALLNFNAQLHSGFYWFVAYCLFAMISGQLLNRFSGAFLPPGFPEHPQKS